MTRATNYEELPQREKIVKPRGAKRPPAGESHWEAPRDKKRGINRSSKARYFDDFAE